MTQEIRDQFASRVSIYDRRSAWILDPGILKLMVDACVAPVDAALLDVCCGTGAVGGAFRGRVGRTVGLDLTPAMLEAAKEKLDEVLVGDANALPFADASFDVVVSRQALHFFAAPARAVKEMHRVLRPGGQVILGQRVPWSHVDAPFWEEVNRLKQSQLVTFMRDDHLAYALQWSGFEGISFRDIGVWESIDDWVASPELRPGHGERILDLYRTAPSWLRAVHPVEVGEDGSVRARWRWVVFTGFKGA